MTEQENNGLSEAAGGNWPRTSSERLGVAVFGVIAGLDGIGFAIAVASLLFSGELRDGLGVAASSCLLCTAVMAAFMGFRSQLPNNVAHVQDIAVAILASTIAATAATMNAPTADRIATAFAIIAVSSVVSGLVLWLTGRFRLGRIVKFFPQAVLAGFLTGTGLLLIKGGVSMVVGRVPTLGNLSFFTSHQSVRLLAPALVFAALIYVCMTASSNSITLLSLLILGLAGFYVWLAVGSETVASARNLGYIPKRPGNAPFETPFPTMLGRVRWSEVLSVAPTVAAVAVLCVFATLLNTSALERITGRDVDIDHELRNTGLANVAVSLLGAPPGYSGLSISLLAEKAGVRLRGVGLVTSAVVLGGFVFANQLVSHIPTFLSAGLVMYLGVDLLNDWLLKTFSKYSRGEWLTVVAILGVVAFSGFFEAMIVGLVISTFLFVYSYARIPVIRQAATLDAMPSTHERSGEEADILRAVGTSVEVVRLQGFLFFGTVEQVLSHLRERLRNKLKPQLTGLLLDFFYVSNLDSASGSSIERICALADQHDFNVIIASANPQVLEALERTTVAFSDSGRVRNFASLDEALESVEEDVLARTPPRKPRNPIANFNEGTIDPAKLADLLSRLRRTTHASGDVILRAGEDADELLFLESGMVVVRRPNSHGEPERIRAMSPGAVIGDVGLSLGTKRTADIVSDGVSTLLHLSAATIREMEQTEPDLAIVVHRIISRALAEKVLTANRMTDQVKG